MKRLPDVATILRQGGQYPPDRVAIAHVAACLVEGVNGAVDVSPVIREVLVEGVERCCAISL